jgi:4-amino-4-deoxy-L-arabinose transferase-like glycosyltransferase
VHSTLSRDSTPPFGWIPRWLPEILLLLTVSLTLHLVGNERISLVDRDEPRYAGCTREMRASGDWVYPTFNAEPRFHKPILIYWLMLGGTAIGGDNPFGARLVSAFAGAASVIVTWFLGRRMFGPSIARWSAIALATAPIFVLESKMATTDATLLLALLGCQFGLWEMNRGASWRWTALFWTSLAVATLTKGPIGPAILVASITATCVFSGSLDSWRRLLVPLWPVAEGLNEGSRLRLAWRSGGKWAPLRSLGVVAELSSRVFARWLVANWGLLLFFAITAPWFIAIGIRSEGAFFDVAFGTHVVHRATTGMETHGGFPGYYVALSLALFYPWSAFLPVSLRAAWSARRAEPAVPFVLGWVIGPLILLECVRTKLIHYYLPAYPACALLVGWILTKLAASESNLRRWRLGRLSFGLLSGIGLTFAIGLFAGVFALPSGMRAACLPMGLLLTAGTIYAADRIQRGLAQRGFATLAGVWALLLLMLGGWFLPAADEYRLSPKVGKVLAELERTEGALPVLGNYKPPGVVYELGHPLPVMEGRMGLRQLVEGKHPVAVAVREEELEKIRSFPEVSVEIRGEPIVGFNVETFKTETLRMALIRMTDSGTRLTREVREPARVE